jgi:hypothetical protein
MGGAVSRTKRLTLDERVQHIRRTPFFLYLDVSTLGEFGKCFPTTVFVKKGDILTLNENLVYIIAKGELNLSTTMADPKYRLESKGYLCKKRPGDIISKPKEQRLATEKVRHCRFISLCPKSQRKRLIIIIEYPTAFSPNKENGKFC